MSFWESHIYRCVMHLLTRRIQAHATRLQPDQGLMISTSDVRGNSDKIRLLRIGVQLKTFRLVVRIPTWRNSDKIQVSRSYNYLLVTSSEALSLHYITRESWARWAWFRWKNSWLCISLLFGLNLSKSENSRNSIMVMKSDGAVLITKGNQR